MIYLYNDLTTGAFRDEPSSITVNSWEVNYLSFCRPENRHKTPLVLIGGAFQLFHSFISDIKAYLPHVPILLIALPGQGSNREVRDASSLGLKDLAELLEGLFNQLGLEYVSIAGFSYGSLLAYTYAYHFENRLEQLILIGCSLGLRHAQRQMLQYSVEAFHPENQHKYAETVSQSLFNLNARAETGLSMNLVEKLTHSIRMLSPKELEDYRSNSSRMLREELPQRFFKVKTLIISAQQDHFILPHESLNVHKLFENSDFMLLEKGDHLVPLQSPKLIYRAILQFLQGRPYEGEGILHGEPAIVRASVRRKQPRYKVKGMNVKVTHPEGFQFVGQLDDVSLDGCGMTLFNGMAVAAEFDGTWFLDIGDSQFEIPGFLRVDNGKASFVFFKKSITAWEQLTDFIQSFQDTPLQDLSFA